MSMCEDYYILNICDSWLTCYMEYKNHVRYLDENSYLDDWDYHTDDKNMTVDIISIHGTDCVSYVTLGMIDDDIIQRSDEIHYSTSINKNILKILKREHDEYKI